MATRLLCRFRVHLAKVLGVLVTQLLLDVGEADAGGLEGLVDDLLRARAGGRGGRGGRVNGMGAGGGAISRGGALMGGGCGGGRGKTGDGCGGAHLWQRIKGGSRWRGRGAGAREAAVRAARGLAGDASGVGRRWRRSRSEARRRRAVATCYPGAAEEDRGPGAHDDHGLGRGRRHFAVSTEERRRPCRVV